MNSIYRQVKYSGVAAIALTMLAAVVLLAGIAIPAQAQTETVLYSFAGTPDGALPQAGPTLVGTTLYGTTREGGTSGSGGASGWGTVWSVSATTGKETILYSFQGSQGGWAPMGGLAHYKGSFYGTTNSGGVGQSGTIFKVTKSGKKYVETILHSFTGPPDGLGPQFVTPVFDKQGNLYGTTYGGGEPGNGTVFKLAPDGTETVLHNFNCNDDGCGPESGVTLDGKGNLYGTTASGGTYGYGILYEITAAGNYSVLYNFTGGDDGYQPYSPPVLDKKGNLWGTSEDGFGFYGTVYKFTPAKGKKTSQMTILHCFTGPPDGASPWAGALVFDKAGNLYGTTAGGGTYTCGTIYKLAPDGTETILYNFNCTPDGQQPWGSVVFDKSGNIYTTTNYGGAEGVGAVIKLTP